MDAHKVTRDLEAELCSYTGAMYAVTTNSCTMAVELSLLWQAYLGKVGEVSIPRYTYPSILQAVVRSGFTPRVENSDWSGMYRLSPLPIWDAARRFTSGMFIPGQFMCLSFHVAKILGDTQGGAILHDDPDANRFLREARFDGRSEGVPLPKDTFSIPPKYTRHCYLSPDVSSRLLNRMQYVSKHNDDLPNDPYPDLEKL